MLTIVIVIDVVVIPLLGFIPLLFLTLDHHYYIYICWPNILSNVPLGSTSFLV